MPDSTSPTPAEEAFACLVVRKSLKVKCFVTESVDCQKRKKQKAKFSAAAPNQKQAYSSYDSIANRAHPLKYL
jgi:hypothetical protein